MQQFTVKEAPAINIIPFDKGVGVLAEIRDGESRIDMVSQA